VTDESGRIVKLTIAAGEPGAGEYLVAWNGHGDAQALYQINAGRGNVPLANIYAYSAWGTPATATHNGVADLGFRFLYVGEYGVQWDDFTGLGPHYMSARHYSPKIGRFLQPDPSAMEANHYGYAGGKSDVEARPEWHLGMRDTHWLVRLWGDCSSARDDSGAGDHRNSPGSISESPQLTTARMGRMSLTV